MVHKPIIVKILSPSSLEFQDGSCNGLQHYAALGRDVLGGRSVNVLPSEKPQVLANSNILAG